MRKTIVEQGLVAFPEVHLVSDFQSGIIDIVQASGFAGMHSNTVMFGWAKDTERVERLLRLVSTNTRMKRNSILACLKRERNGSSQNGWTASFRG